MWFDEQEYHVLFFLRIKGIQLDLDLADGKVDTVDKEMRTVLDEYNL